MTSIRQALQLLINLENSLEDKCDLLTAIGVTARNEEIFKECEEIRNEIVPDNTEMEKIGLELLRSRDSGEKYSDSNGVQELDGTYEDSLSCL